MTDSNNLSRRALLGGIAATGAVAGCGDDAAPAGPNPDVMTLNVLLTAEFEAVKAYEAGIGILRMPPTGDPQAAAAAPLQVIATNWQAQHRDHAMRLGDLIRSLGGQPIAEASVNFTAPAGFTPSVANVLRLACNKERAAAVAYNRAVKALRSTSTRFLAGNIEGDETQHFIVLYALLKQVVAADTAGLITNIMEVVPRPYVSATSATTMNGLQTVADFTYT